jgi:hypothetical protein
MAFVSKAELLELKKTKPNVQVYNYGRQRYEGAYVLGKDMTEAKADEILSSALRTTLAVEQAKINRPWEIVDLTKQLDPKQPWLGFEFEMGFTLKADYDRLINHLWHNTNHVAIDREGYGNYCPEVTFSPENLDGYMHGTSTIHGVIKWMNEQKVPLANFGQQYVGTHVNMSTPAYRKGSQAARARCSGLINQSILTMNQTEYNDLFGRKPYGLGTVQDGGWIEYKMFKSTDDLRAFNRYIEVSKNLAEVMEYLMVNAATVPATTSVDNKSRFITNFADILRGKVKSNKMLFREIDDHTRLAATASMHWRARTGETFPDARKTAVEVGTKTTEVLKRYAY